MCRSLDCDRLNAKPRHMTNHVTLSTHTPLAVSWSILRHLARRGLCPSQLCLRPPGLSPLPAADPADAIRTQSFLFTSSPKSRNQIHS